ncbi:MAG: hypothetical protein H6655_00310 [Ardenticatenaceae bacterium]|nr:hypothetical protein [Ardenticatenaceae bacterium]
MNGHLEKTAVSAPLSRLHWLLSVQTAVILFGSLNRLGSWTLDYVAANAFLRWVDFHNMLTLPLISVTAFYLLKLEIERGERRSNGRLPLLLNLTFIIGLYLFAASYGSHETTNYLHARFCPAGDTTDLCRIVIFNDDDFSHWLFFAGFVLINGALMLLQVVFPIRDAVGWRDTAVLTLNGLFVALGIFANLGFEAIGLDLVVVLGLAVLSGWLLWRNGRQPLLVYYAVAYGVGLVLTAVYRLVVSA